MPDQIRHEDERAVEDTDKNGSASLIVLADLFSEFTGTRLNLVFGNEEHESLIVDCQFFHYVRL